MKKNSFRLIWLFIAPLLALLFIIYQPLPAGDLINKMFAVVIWMAIWWLSECVHLAVTSLLPIILLPLLGIANVKNVSKEYGDSIIFLFLGGFLFSIAIEKWDLHQRIASAILKVTGNSLKGILAGVMIAAFLISNWISNTATTLMLFGAIMALYKELEPHIKAAHRKQFAVALLLGLAYAASIGGIATPVGTPPNMYFFKVYPQLFGNSVHINFMEWIIKIAPISIIIIVGCYLILSFLFLRTIKQKKIATSFLNLKKQYKISYEEKWIAVIFLICVVLWITREGWHIGNTVVYGWQNIFQYSHYIDDAVVAIAGATLLFIIPSKKNKGEAILVWTDVKSLKYDILLLFGGGFALAYGFNQSGLDKWLIGQFEFIKHLHPLLIIIVISVVVTLTSEFASNIASIQLALPVIAAMLVHLPNKNILMYLIPCVVSASVGFMLPVATPPNTIVFGSGLVGIKDMFKAGLLLDIWSIIVVSLYCYIVF